VTYFLDTLVWMFTPQVLLTLILGVFGGLIVGAVPGLTSTMAVGLLVPITFGMDAQFGIAMVVAVYVGAISGGLVSAVLLNIPGTPSSVATTFDGFPMAKNGQAGRALSLGIWSSFIGGTISAMALAVIAPQLAKFAIKFSPYEYFALVIFTLTCIGVLSKGSTLKGLIAGCVGLLLSFVGTSWTDSVTRFTFGVSALEAGFAELPVLIGMFAMTQILQDVSQISKPFTVLKPNFTIREFGQVIVESASHIGNFARSSLIGIVIGILPGVGPGLSNILAYAQAKTASKHPETFGKGEPDGIIASETANNAATGGAMIPLLTLGIPGDATTLMMLGAFMIHGIQPGPLLFRDSGAMVMAIIAVFFLCNFLMMLIQMFCIPVFVKCLLVPRYLLYPVVLVMCIVGCYALNSRMLDVWVFVGFGLVGYFLSREGFPLLPVILGLILGRMAENQFRVGLAISSGSIMPFITRPVSALLLLAAVLSLILPPILEKRHARKAQKAI
jgi:putative tricarboxylic transport membrane protein